MSQPQQQRLRIATHGTFKYNYDENGDAGSSGLADGTTTLPKDHPVFEVMGTVDETNCCLGLIRVHSLPTPIDDELRQLQNDLFDLGADVATPYGVAWEDRLQRITDSYISRIEAWTAAHGELLQPLTSFTLPGGSAAAAAAHQARAVSRRAERVAIAAWPHLPNVESRPGREPLIFLNRLSDYLFQISRRLNDNGATDVLWQPGTGSAADE